MNIKKTVFTLTIVLLTVIAYSQNTSASFSNHPKGKDPYRFRNNSLSYNISGTTQYLGLTYERIFSKYTSAELGLGVWSAGLGVKAYLYKIQNDKFNFHTGITALYCGDRIYDSFIKTYIPFGVSYLLSDGLAFSADLGPSKDYYSSNSSTTIRLYGNIKAGIRF